MSRVRTLKLNGEPNRELYDPEKLNGLQTELRTIQEERAMLLSFLGKLESGNDETSLEGLTEDDQQSGAMLLLGQKVYLASKLTDQIHAMQDAA